MSDAMHAVFANNDALVAECERLRTANAAMRSDIAQLCALLREVRAACGVEHLSR